jgi:hypothetical protein
MLDNPMSFRAVFGGVLAAALVLVVGLVSAVPASAAVPWWHITVTTAPTNLPPGGEGEIHVKVVNLGDAPAEGEGEPITISDLLPAGVTATSIAGGKVGSGNEEEGCELAPLGCRLTETLLPYEPFEINIRVAVAGSVSSGAVDKVTVSGGGAAAAVVSRPLVVSSTPAGFGVEEDELRPSNEDGSPDTQAGSHPFELTSTFNFNEELKKGENGDERQPVALGKDLRFDLPAGLVANPTVVPQCTERQFTTEPHGGLNVCPASTAIGVAGVTTGFGDGATFTVPLFNLVPAVGEPARFGFLLPGGVKIYLDTSVRTGGDYGAVVSVNNITQLLSLHGAQVTFWDVPSDPRHDNSRGWQCTNTVEMLPCSVPSGAPSQTPFITMPTLCGGAFESTVSADSWKEPGVFAHGRSVLRDSSGAPLGVDGCNRLPFDPSISVAPDGTAASTPTGLTFGLHIGQEGVLNPEGLGGSALRDTTFVLPEGMQLSPAAADGLLSCSLEQVGLESAAKPTCPDASKVGTVEITTPLLPNKLTGAAYLAEQDQNPFGSLVALYIVAEDPVSGVLVKQAGQVELDPVTGRVTAVFSENPQLPFSELNLSFFGSARAPLSTPSSCGAYTTSASFTPWSGSPPVEASSTFDITTGPEGSPCSSPRPFSPGFEAGTLNLQAGAYTPLTLTMTRPDADQTLGKLSVVFPPGVSAGLRGVKLCEEPQAAQGQCPAESQIGKVVASAGLGSAPYSVETGKAYITGPYEGDPFGVEIVVPAIAGPFNLGTEIVRSKVDVDPTDAHLTVVSDPFPTILDGIPLQLQHVNVTVDRPGFVFNPTSCEPMKLTGELESTEGAKADVATPFQVTNCGSLAFKPEFKVSTEAKTSRTEGATLHVALTLPAGAQGTKANVAKVKVSLPKQLPSPLKTLQKACTEKVFAEKPSGCPVASRVGEATVSTPVLEGPLSGPAYFVSHGGAKYPELIMVLVGEDGVTVDVRGETFISKQGITSATFNTVPDVPFSTFELTLPKREFPALSANGNLCKAQAAGKLLMPTELVGQNGAKINQSTKISVTGCPKTKKVAHKKKHKAHGKSKKGRKK